MQQKTKSKQVFIIELLIARRFKFREKNNHILPPPPPPPSIIGLSLTNDHQLTPEEVRERMKKMIKDPIVNLPKDEKERERILKEFDTPLKERYFPEIRKGKIPEQKKTFLETESSKDSETFMHIIGFILLMVIFHYLIPLFS
jgi:hypothetical protein